MRAEPRAARQPEWLPQQGELPAERILDAAGRCFAVVGVMRASMEDIAREAGCSRPTVYRYFEDRDALRIAFIHREARRIAAGVNADAAGITDPAERLITAAMAAVTRVRENPTLTAWFTEAAVGRTTGLARSSEVIGSLAAGFVGASSTDPDPGRWLVRVILSLLAMPESNPQDERWLLERFVVPGILAAERAAQ
jgi:AcrR family transcriptional regulator